jgi:hypothetical protein
MPCNNHECIDIPVRTGAGEIDCSKDKVPKSVDAALLSVAVFLAAAVLVAALAAPVDGDVMGVVCLLQFVATVGRYAAGEPVAVALLHAATTASILGEASLEHGRRLEENPSRYAEQPPRSTSSCCSRQLKVPLEEFAGEQRRETSSRRFFKLVVREVGFATQGSAAQKQPRQEQRPNGISEPWSPLCS